MVSKTRVVVDLFAEKQIKKLPHYIKEALQDWVETIEQLGLREARKLKGYRDEPLKGQRRGQRSARLSKAYRVIYIETIEIVEVLVIEVNKHDY